jgi:phospholipase/lecithinase/hemolysin
MKTIALAALAGVWLVGGVAQAASVNYTSLYVFGDSLSDPGNRYAASGGTTPPSPPYYQGRFSNGPVWAEHLAAKFEARGLDTANFAFGGATAAGTDRNDPIIEDLPDQLASFALAPKTPGRRPVATLWAGANDIIGTIETTPTPEAVATAAVGAATAIARSIVTLRDYGVKHVVVLNLPSLDTVPAFTSAPPGARALAGFGSDLFNDTLAGLIEGMERRKRIEQVDIEALFADLLADPQKYGVENATIPCIIPGVSICSPEEAQRRAFFDPLHPNGVVHGAIAGVVGDKVAPVPLPAPALLLVAGLAALGLAARAGRSAPA